MKFIKNDLSQLIIAALVLTAFNYYLAIVNPANFLTLFGGWEWLWIIEDPVRSVSMYLFPIVVPILCLVQGLRMIKALMSNTGIKKSSLINNSATKIVQLIYVYVAVMCFVSFVLWLRLIFGLM